MKRAITKHAGDFAAVVGLILIATVVSVYILQNQRLRFPIVEESPFILKAEMATGQAVTPGQGQTVRVSGVRIGDISKVELENGRAIIEMEVDQEYSDLVREDAFALLRPKTGLKDMFVELFPGSKDAKVVKEDFTIPIRNTLPDVNPDEFLSALDRDTRDYLQLLLNGAARGLDGRSEDLRDVLKRFEPLNRHIAQVTGEVAKRRQELRRLVHALNVLNTELGRKDDDLAELVSTSATVFEQFAAERDNVAATVRELPSTLRVTTDALERVERLAKVIPSTTTRLRPAVRAIRVANRKTLPFAREAAPQLRRDIRPFVREARPLVRELRPAVHDLAEGEPDLTRTIAALNGFFNLLAFNKDGAEPPGKRERDEGYLFYLAWLSHQSVSIFSGQDANGVFRPFVAGGTCQTFRSTFASSPAIEALVGITGVLNDERVCGGKGENPTTRTKAERAGSTAGKGEQ